MSAKHRVVITGIGLVTPLGNDTNTTWQSLINGRSGIKKIPTDFFTGFSEADLANFPYTIAGLVSNEKAALDAVFSPKNQARADRFIHLCMLAGHHAMVDAGFTTPVEAQAERFGVYLGIGIGGLASITQTAQKFLHDGPDALKRVSPFMIPKVISNQAAGWLSMQWNLQGPTQAIVNACSSSGDALGMSFRAIRDGYADTMLTGGAEACVMPMALAGFGNMRTLASWQGDPTQASRPFDKNRNGFVMAEGAGLLVLEREDLARKRGAQIYAEVVGYGATSDAYHMTAMHPDGRGATRAITEALADAQIDRSEIGYINAHGTSTPMNDAIETLVLKKVFGHHIDPTQADHILVSSTKSMTGHMLGGAGGTEAAITALALKHGILPPTINLSHADPACDLDYIPHQAREKKIAYAMSNSFGFGGGNAVVVLKK
jgi:3-oxoacyl-[acyl-carrier-protein] synthase II